MLITDSAQERINHILSNLDYRTHDTVFRISLEGGGCTGFKYNFTISESEDNDLYINGIENKVVVDPISMMFLQGSTLDFKDTIFSQTFVIDNPNVKTTCGCGESIGF